MTNYKTASARARESESTAPRISILTSHFPKRPSIRRKPDNKISKISNVTKLVEEKVDSAIHKKMYEGLHDSLNRYESKTLDILYKKTQDGEIDLEKTEGKQIWKKVIEFYEEEEKKEKISSIYSNIAEHSIHGIRKSIYEFIRGAIFSLCAGITARFEVGREFTDAFTNYISKKKLK